MNESTEVTVEATSSAVDGAQLMRDTEAAQAKIVEEGRAQLAKQRESIMEVSENAEKIVAEAIEKLQDQLQAAAGEAETSAIRAKLLELQQLAIQMRNLRQADAGLEFLLETQPSKEYIASNDKTMFLLRKVTGKLKQSKMIFTDVKTFLGSLVLVLGEDDAREMAIRVLFFADRHKLEVFGIGISRVMSRIATAGRLIAAANAGQLLSESAQKFIESAKASSLSFLAAARTAQV